MEILHDSLLNFSIRKALQNVRRTVQNLSQLRCVASDLFICKERRDRFSQNRTLQGILTFRCFSYSLLSCEGKKRTDQFKYGTFKDGSLGKTRWLSMRFSTLPLRDRAYFQAIFPCPRGSQGVMEMSEVGKIDFSPGRIPQGHVRYCGWKTANVLSA